METAAQTAVAANYQHKYYEAVDKLSEAIAAIAMCEDKIRSDAKLNQNKIEHLKAAIAMKADKIAMLKQFITRLYENYDLSVADSLLFDKFVNTIHDESVSEWEEKKLEPLRKQVVMLRSDLEKFGVCRCKCATHGYSCGLAESTCELEEKCEWCNTLDDTKAAADVYMAEHDARLAQEIADELYSRTFYEASREVKAIAELRATSKKW